jgi:hypothetical protein
MSKNFKSILSILLRLIILSRSPVQAGISLLLVIVFLTISWNSGLDSSIISLIYIRGILILLLFLTSLIAELKEKASKVWLGIALVTPMIGLEFQSKYSYSFVQLLDTNFLRVLIFIFIILVLVIVILTLSLRVQETRRLL